MRPLRSIFPWIALPSALAACAGNPTEALPSGDATSSAASTMDPSDPTTLDSTADTSTGGDAICGNGIKEGAEECDFGELNGEGQCRDICVLNVCGDMYLAPGELCDDGNVIAGDGCSASCGPDTCGDALVDPGEECDDGNADATDGCTNACTLPVCGDGVVQSPLEVCDGGTDAPCSSVGMFDSGTLACTPTCTYDTTACALCGDGQVGPGENCDGPLIDTCESLGFDSGALACTACQIDVAGCGTCGNGIIDGNEECDGAMLGGGSCAPLVGPVSCGMDCVLDVSQCVACGNGVIDVPEECDGAALPGGGCFAFGYDRGILFCQDDCTANTVGCCYDGVDDDCGFGASCCPGLQCDDAIDECCATMLGTACGNDQDCCGALECDNQNAVCCRPSGAGCNAPADCCSNTCTMGSCVGNDS